MLMPGFRTHDLARFECCMSHISVSTLRVLLLAVGLVLEHTRTNEKALVLWIYAPIRAWIRRPGHDGIN
jgi:hypothetical protein